MLNRSSPRPDRLARAATDCVRDVCDSTCTSKFQQQHARRDATPLCTDRTDVRRTSNRSRLVQYITGMGGGWFSRGSGTLTNFNSTWERHLFINVNSSEATTFTKCTSLMSFLTDNQSSTHQSSSGTVGSCYSTPVHDDRIGDPKDQPALYRGQSIPQIRDTPVAG